MYSVFSTIHCADYNVDQVQLIQRSHMASRRLQLGKASRWQAHRMHGLELGKASRCQAHRACEEQEKVLEQKEGQQEKWLSKILDPMKRV